jgi:hypothetical protein
MIHSDSRNETSFSALIALSLTLVICSVFINPNPLVAQSSDDAYRVRPEVADRINDAWKFYRKGQIRQTLNQLRPLLSRSDLPPDVYLLAGRAYFDRNNFSRSSRQLRKALDRLRNHESRPNVERYLNRSDALRDLNLRKRTFAHFTILRVPELSAIRVSNLNHDLEKARRRIGGDLDLMLDKRLTVILYPRPQYRRVVEAPVWSGGVFDGKIHLPFREDSDNPYTQRTLYHEYSHALIHEIARDNVPLWFNEGFATYQEYRQSREHFKYRQLSSNPPPKHVRNLEDVSAMFRDTDDRNEARLAYEYSYSLVKFLEERFGLISLKRILKETGRTSSFEKAVETELGRSLDSLQFSWENWVNQEIRR